MRIGVCTPMLYAMGTPRNLHMRQIYPSQVKENAQSCRKITRRDGTRAQILTPVRSGVCSLIGQRIRCSFTEQNLRLLPCAKLLLHSMSCRSRYRSRRMSSPFPRKRQRNSALIGRGRRSPSTRVCSAIQRGTGRSVNAMQVRAGREERAGHHSIRQGAGGNPLRVLLLCEDSRTHHGRQGQDARTSEHHDRTGA